MHDSEPEILFTYIIIIIAFRRKIWYNICISAVVRDNLRSSKRVSFACKIRSMEVLSRVKSQRRAGFPLLEKASFLPFF